MSPSELFAWTLCRYHKDPSNQRGSAIVETEANVMRQVREREYFLHLYQTGSGSESVL
jgi:fumarate hydratase class II